MQNNTTSYNFLEIETTVVNKINELAFPTIHYFIDISHIILPC